MRILHVVSSINPMYGGPVEFIRQAHRTMVPMGHLSEVVTLDHPDSPWLEKVGLPVHSAGLGNRPYYYSPDLVPWLRKHASDYDAVIVNGLWQYSGLGAYRALSQTGQPYFVFTHGMLDPYFNRAYPLKRIRKQIYWPFAEYRVLHNARAVLFTCEEERRLARQAFWPNKWNEEVVLYGTARPGGEAEPQRAAFLTAFPQLAGKRIVLFISRIHVKKGCDLLIKAFARVADQDSRLMLVIAGPDETGWKAELVRLAESLGVADRIVWTGMIAGDVKYGAFRAADVFMLPSHQENFGIAVAEALACSVPVLITNKINIWREIVDDGAGLVADDTEAGATDLLRRWLALADEDREKMRVAAQACFSNRYEIARTVTDLIQTLKRLTP